MKWDHNEMVYAKYFIVHKRASERQERKMEEERETAYGVLRNKVCMYSSSNAPPSSNMVLVPYRLYVWALSYLNKK